MIDHAKRAGEKIRISGGGRCNFTNLHTRAANFISANPHFAKSALARYTPWDFISLIGGHGLTYHEKTLGQLFCDQKSGAIIQVLLDEAQGSGADIWLNTELKSLSTEAEGDGNGNGNGYRALVVRDGQAVTISAENVVVATGGKSIPKMGATGLGYDMARQFGLPLIDTRPGLVPFTFAGDVRDQMARRSGLSAQARVSAGGKVFAEGLLFTHRGLSGPSLLQVSSYWQIGETLGIDFAPKQKIGAVLTAAKRQNPSQKLAKALSALLPASVLSFLIDAPLLDASLQTLSQSTIETLAQQIHACTLRPAGTEGYRTAEVTVGGVDTNALSSQTMAAKAHPGLYFIGEVVDVTGWLGGYNFQWAWASAAAAGRAIVSGP